MRDVYVKDMDEEEINEYCKTRKSCYKCPFDLPKTDMEFDCYLKAKEFFDKIDEIRNSKVKITLDE